MYDAIILNNLAQLYIETNNYKKSIECLKLALESLKKRKLDKNPEAEILWTDLGNIFIELGDYKSARECFQESVHLLEKNVHSARFSPALRKLIYCEEKLGNQTAAAELKIRLRK